MGNINKKRVAVLYGGKSAEHEISILSAQSVLAAVDKELFEVVPIGIDKHGEWYLNELKQDTGVGLQVKYADSQPVISSRQMFKHYQIDVVFPVVHGPPYEDGCLQGMLELAQIAYVGSGVLSSAVGMDKEVAKLLVEQAQIATAPSMVLHDFATATQRQVFCQAVVAELGLPVVVKPANTGSSVGIHKITTAADLPAALEDAFRYDHKLLVEKFIVAREIEFAVLENPSYGGAPLVSVAGEIEVQAKHQFYSYAAKYLDPAGARLQVPAVLSDTLLSNCQQVASQIFNLLECSGMARVDLFIDRQTDKIYFNELNSLPGFTNISMYPKLWQASGIEYSNLLTKLIELALARWQRKQQLLTDYA